MLGAAGSPVIFLNIVLPHIAFQTQRMCELIQLPGEARRPAEVHVQEPGQKLVAPQALPPVEIHGSVIKENVHGVYKIFLLFIGK